ncbi:ANKRD50 [Symbiodinium natans]|uniref:ANKRD50 protein n=1 Tax=Symbiodinium natans TaxID=878477 RepID=A0A812UGU0_9DINO|nr:ANKRD50 [Symbiodinium natans]
MVAPLVPKGKNVDELQQGLEEALYSYIDAAPKKKEEDLEGQVEKVEQLLSAGACPNTAGPRGATPLSQPAFQGRAAVVDVLLQSRAQVGLRDSNGRTPLFLAEQGGHLQVVQMLLQRNAQVDSFDSSGRTPLLDAAEWGTSEMVDALLRSKAGVNFCDMHGNSPLSAAAGKGASEIVRMLLKSRAQDSGTQQAASKRCLTALDEAARHGHSEVVDLLVKSRAQVEPLTLLRAALTHQKDQVRVVDLLLESRAQVDRQTVTAVAKYGSPDAPNRVPPNGRPLPSGETPYVRRKVVDQQEKYRRQQVKGANALPPIIQRSSSPRSRPSPAGIEEARFARSMEAFQAETEFLEQQGLDMGRLACLLAFDTFRSSKGKLTESADTASA